ncbi:MAG: Glyoxalase/bleomycin resistance protein/dioxygenase [Edaphobacter sp.]|nr:Glyoxalase/bleomycin resistance protein/dioxygenase [Edaphobacter sp.]
MSEQRAKRGSAVAWFEIPSRDLDRAQRFYETILQCTMKKDDFGTKEDVVCVFPAEQTGVAGALVKRSFQRPGSEGTMVYLSCDGKLDAVIGRVEAAGGKVIVPRTPVAGGNGAFACMRDSEGNHVGLHTAI